MSSAEIADNKWELSSTKPPLKSAGGIMQLALMGGFVALFGWLIGSSVIGLVTPKAEDGGLAGKYKNMGVDGEKAAEE
ncbi:MAG: hypothetical protein AAF799_08710 [Myxococcota bacterium]